MQTFVIKQGDQELARITGENFVFGKRTPPGAPMNVTTMVDDPKLLKMVDSTDNSTVFLVTLSSRPGLEIVALDEHTPPVG